jgi:predicted O-methyltransferase YrrM
MPTTEDVTAAVYGLSATTAERGRVLAEMVRDHGARDVLVVGFDRGVSSCYLAAALGVEGHVVTVGFAHRAAMSPSIDELLATCGLSDRATVFYEFLSYNWRLQHFLAQRPRPQFDLVLINGRHLWDTEALAFLLAEQLLAPGGYMILAALHWRLAKSAALASATTHVPQDIRDSKQVYMVFEQLVADHPHIAECWEDGQWGFVRKRDDAGVRDLAARAEANRLLRQQAGATAQRARLALESQNWRRLAAPHPVTGAVFAPDPVPEEQL